MSESKNLFTKESLDAMEPMVESVSGTGIALQEREIGAASKVDYYSALDGTTQTEASLGDFETLWLLRFRG